MDVSAAMQQFYDDKGNISIPDQLTLSGMNEMLFALAGMQGTADDVLFRYHDFSSSREGEVIEWTRAQVNTRIKAVSVRLRQVTTPGDRVAILANNSPEYLIGFVGALYAGTVPVPLYDPTEPGHGAHLTAVLASSTPTVVLTNKNSAADVRKHFSDLPAGERPRILTVDALPDSLAEDWENPMTLFAEHPELAPKAGDPAFLQYTSGSTRAPAGVVLTHRNIVTNVLQVFQAGQLQMPMRLVNWLPLHHDMGIILASFCLILGIPQDIMSPRDFIQDPGRWIRQLSEKGTVGEDAVNVYAAVPNFALELAARYANPAEREDLADVDLSHVEGVINGAEAVSLQSIDRFQDVFGPYGFVRSAMRPSYGLAEATVFVSTPQTENRPLLRVFDREELSTGRIVELPESESDSDKAMAIVSVGAPGPNEAVVVVDPETGKELPLGSVGELWIHGNNVAAGYLDRDEETVETFRNELPEASRLDDSAAARVPEDNWLRTGDLAVIIDGEIYVTGRIKDLIVIAGRNHYPQDIEATAQEATDQILRDVIAAFAVDTGSDVEELIIIAERDPEADPAGDADAVAAVRSAVTSVHGVQPTEVRIVDQGSIPRSSANKIARRVASKLWTDGAFA